MHAFLVAGVTLAYFILGDLIHLTIPSLEGDQLYFLFLPIAAIIGSQLIFKTFLKKITKSSSDDEKFATYQTASVMKWAILEGAAFVILFIKPELLLFGFIVLLYFIYDRPTKNKIEEELNIKI